MLCFLQNEGVVFLLNFRRKTILFSWFSGVFFFADFNPPNIRFAPLG